MPRELLPLHYFSTWLLVATVSVQVLSWPNCKCISVQMPLMTKRPCPRSTTVSHLLYSSQWARCELLPRLTNWSSHPKMWGWGSGWQACAHGLTLQVLGPAFLGTVSSEIPPNSELRNRWSEFLMIWKEATMLENHLKVEIWLNKHVYIY